MELQAVKTAMPTEHRNPVAAPASSGCFDCVNDLVGRICCVDLRTGVFIVLSVVAVAGFALSFFPDLNVETFQHVAYALFASLSIYLAKDAYDRQRQLEDVTERLESVNGELKNTQKNFEETTGKLGKVEADFESAKREFAQTQTSLRTEVKNLKKVIANDLGAVVAVIKDEGEEFHTENVQLKEAIQRLDTVADRLGFKALEKDEEAKKPEGLIKV